jgi:hypothetical protein
MATRKNIEKKNKDKGDVIPQERGLKGISLFIIFFLPILVLIGKWLHQILGRKAMWFLISM